MGYLELLAPARNADIGIAAIDCGADAVYIAGPAFGARKDAGNSVEDIARLCDYAHRFGVRIFVTVNIILRDDELPAVHAFMLDAQKAGADAFIIRDMRICGWDDITVPLHASTQCAIRDVESARRYEAAGCSRIVLERELSLEQIKQICDAVSCEVECFVHGALCVGYSGECRLSEYLNGRSADRGECVQACRSLYDLVDGNGRTLVRGKALLSLRDFDLHDRLEELAAAGVCSFKIEGRLKNISYVRNITRLYSKALDALVDAAPERWCRGSFGRVSGGFKPDADKTFTRGYTSLFFDGKRGKWSSMDAPKSMGECVGTVAGIKRSGKTMTVRVKGGAQFNNGDGFAFVSGNAIVGFRADTASGSEICCKDVPELREGMTLYRNVNAAFERELERNACRREISVELNVRISGAFTIVLEATTEDGRTLSSSYKADVEKAENRERAEAMLREQLGKRALHYSFHVGDITAGASLPLLSASTINSMRRLLAEDLDRMPCGIVPMQRCPIRSGMTKAVPGMAKAATTVLPSLPAATGNLLRSKYCVKYELGLCPKHQGAKPTGELFLINNGRRLALQFDCKACEMSVFAD